ncbi:hypothetical protein [Mangrovibacterium sp.]|uniref:hypothetical protein n=1 Tax=Mangrovibacterium sp. TaxID=1961364 RepID=UPI00356AB583
MADQTNIGLTVEAWAEIVIDKWETMIARLHIGHSGNLINSFTHHVITQSGGNPELIEFTFEYYGKFVDMGVGRGVTIGEVEFSDRRRKPWYSKTFFSQVKKLGEILGEKYARKGQAVIIENLEKKE